MGGVTVTTAVAVALAVTKETEIIITITDSIVDTDKDTMEIPTVMEAGVVAVVTVVIEEEEINLTGADGVEIRMMEETESPGITNLFNNPLYPFLKNQIISYT